VHDHIENVNPFDRYCNAIKDTHSFTILPFQFALRPMIVAFVERAYLGGIS